MSIKKGDEVGYRLVLNGNRLQVMPAKVAAVHADGTLDLEYSNHLGQPRTADNVREYTDASKRNAADPCGNRWMPKPAAEELPAYEDMDVEELRELVARIGVDGSKFRKAKAIKELQHFDGLVAKADERGLAEPASGWTLDDIKAALAGS